MKNSRCILSCRDKSTTSVVPSGAEIPKNCIWDALCGHRLGIGTLSRSLYIPEDLYFSSCFEKSSLVRNEKVLKGKILGYMRILRRKLQRIAKYFENPAIE